MKVTKEEIARAKLFDNECRVREMIASCSVCGKKFQIMNLHIIDIKNFICEKCLKESKGVKK